MKVLVINGPNLNLLGRREPEVYGTSTFEDLNAQILSWAAAIGVGAEARQSNHEGEIVELVQETTADGVVINPGALGHTSRALADAIRSVGTPVVEVHISNVFEREPWRASSVIADSCVRTIYGRGVSGYRDAIRHLVNRDAMRFETIRYGPHPDQVGDLRRGDAGLVVIAHGGVWRHEYERDITESLAIDLTRRGYHTWNIEYRRIGRGGGWPASAQDVVMALDFVPQLGISHDDMTVVGHSAGSQLLMWAAERTRAPIRLHVAMAPLTDLGASVASHDVGAPQAELLMSQGAPEMMTPGEVETVIVHGGNDQVVAVERSELLASDRGLEIHRTDADHFQLLDPTRPEWQWVIRRLETPGE